MRPSLTLLLFYYECAPLSTYSRDIGSCRCLFWLQLWKGWSHVPYPRSPAVPSFGPQKVQTIFEPITALHPTPKPCPPMVAGSANIGPTWSKTGERPMEPLFWIPPPPPPPISIFEQPTARYGNSLAGSPSCRSRPVYNTKVGSGVETPF